MPHRLLTACFLSACLLSNVMAAEERRPRNVLLIMSDDLNCDLGCYGHPLVKTPHLDALAARGRIFMQTHCQYPLCGPSRASLVTGLYPDQTTIKKNNITIRQCLPDVVSLGQAFRQQGYLSSRIGKIYHLGIPKDIGTDGSDDPASWDETFNPKGIDVDKAFEREIFSLQPGRFGATLSWRAAPGDGRDHTDALAVDRAIEVLQREADGAKPFFLAVGLVRPHTPFVAPQALFDQYDLRRVTIPPLPRGYHASLPAPARELLTRHQEQNDLPEETARRAVQAYYASISFVDAQVGRLLNALEEQGLREDTVVVFTSDHGYHLGQHGHYQKLTLFNDATRVPFIISVPGMPRPGEPTTRTLGELVDLYPTVLDLVGLKAPDWVQGRSLAPAVEDPDAEVRQVSITQCWSGDSLRTLRWRLTLWGDGGQDGVELYDQRADPHEMNNLADSAAHRRVLDELKGLLQGRLAATARVPEGLTQRPYQDKRKKTKRTGRGK